MALKKGTFNSGIKNLEKSKFRKGKSGYSFEYKKLFCESCRKEFSSNGPNPKYCSTKCRDKCRSDKQKKDFICEFCQTEFKRRSPTNFGRFCSRQCSGMWKIANGKKNYFYKAFLYQEHRCNRCLISDYELLVVHHIDENHKNHDIKNLEILCANCHYRIHFGQGRTRKDKIDRIKKYLKDKEEKCL